MRLTFCAVSAVSNLPAGSTHSLSVATAGVVAKLVVARLADHVAVAAVVVVGADQPVVVVEGRVRARDPAGAAVQAPRLGDPVEQGVVATCNILQRLGYTTDK